MSFTVTSNANGKSFKQDSDGQNITFVQVDYTTNPNPSPEDNVIYNLYIQFAPDVKHLFYLKRTYSIGNDIVIDVVTQKHPPIPSAQIEFYSQGSITTSKFSVIWGDFNNKTFIVNEYVLDPNEETPGTDKYNEFWSNSATFLSATAPPGRRKKPVSTVVHAGPAIHAGDSGNSGIFTRLGGIVRNLLTWLGISNKSETKKPTVSQ